MDLYPRVPPVYWLAVVKSTEAIELLFSGEAQKMGWSNFFQTYPVASHPDFPAVIMAYGEVTGWQPPGRQYAGMAEWLGRAQEAGRRVPAHHAAELFNLGVDLKDETGGERRANLQQAANAFQGAAEVYAQLNDAGMLQQCRTAIANINTILATG